VRPVAAASRVPSGLNASAVAPVTGSDVDRDVRRFQSRTGPLSRVIASAVPAGSNATAPAGLTGNLFCEPVRTSQTMRPAGPAIATVRPSGLSATLVTANASLRRAIGRFDGTSQTTAPELVMATSSLPSELNARSSASDFNVATSE